MASSFLFTSESVSEGHPDKMADQISDAVLDAMLAQDPASRVACETMVNTGLAVIAGEVTSNSEVDLAQTVRNTIKDIGYNSSEMGFDYSSCAVMVTLDKQSVDIAQGVNEGEGLDRNQGAGDQGLAPVEEVVIDRVHGSLSAALDQGLRPFGVLAVCIQALVHVEDVRRGAVAAPLAGRCPEEVQHVSCAQ